MLAAFESEVVVTFLKNFEVDGVRPRRTVCLVGPVGAIDQFVASNDVVPRYDVGRRLHLFLIPGTKIEKLT